MAERPIEINLTEIIRARLGEKKSRFVPGFLLRGLEKLICQKRLNEILRESFPARGSEFSKRVIEILKLEVEVSGLENLPDNEAFEFVSNHPLGGLDGITLVAVLGERYGDENIRVLVNDMLMNVEPLSKVFLPINKYGGQARESVRLINEAYAGGKQILMFPAGLVSRLHPDGAVRDLTWQKAFVQKALEYDRRIVPVRFEGLNGMRFYRMARLRRRLGLRINLEQAMLPSELCRAEGKRFRIIFGAPIDPAQLKAEGKTPAEIAAELHDYVYSLKFAGDEANKKGLSGR